MVSYEKMIIIGVVLIAVAVVVYFIFFHNSEFINDSSLKLNEMMCPGFRLEGVSSKKLDVKKTQGFITNGEQELELILDLNGDNGRFNMHRDLPHKMGDRICVDATFVAEDGSVMNKTICINAEKDCM